MAFAPLDDPPRDAISPTEAINLIAGAVSDDALDHRAYDVGIAEIDAANRKLFGWLNSRDIVGAVHAADGSWWRLDIAWLRSHRRQQRHWVENPDDRAGELLPVLVETIDNLPDEVWCPTDLRFHGRPWFVERAKVIDCKDGLSGLTGDDRLVAKMRIGVENGTYKSLHAASLDLAQVAKGAMTELASKAQRLRNRERATRPGS